MTATFPDDERSPERKEDLEARLDDLGKKSPQKEGPGQAGDTQRLSSVAESSEESVEELTETEQSLEAASVEGSEDAADHPERPAHTHTDYGRPDDLPPRKRDDEAA
jgi:hypothetical protein